MVSRSCNGELQLLDSKVRLLLPCRLCWCRAALSCRVRRCAAVRRCGVRGAGCGGDVPPCGAACVCTRSTTLSGEGASGCWAWRTEGRGCANEGAEEAHDARDGADDVEAAQYAHDADHAQRPQRLRQEEGCESVLRQNLS